MSLGQVKESVLLNIGENNLKDSAEKVYLKEVDTRFHAKCYNLTAIRNIDGKLTVLEFSSRVSQIPKMNVYFTSERNSYGITNSDWKDGKVFSVETSNDNSKGIDLTVEKYIHLKCQDQSFYQCATSKILKSECSQQCNLTCIPVTNPICNNLIDYYDYVECGCHLEHTYDVMQNITTNYECPQSCEITQYVGTIIWNDKLSWNSNVSLVQYKYVTPLFLSVYEEYIICDLINLVGSVGGTLGLFIGFSFNNILAWLIENIQLSFNVIKHNFRRANENEKDQTQQKLNVMELELKKISKRKKTLKTPSKFQNKFGLNLRDRRM